MKRIMFLGIWLVSCVAVVTASAGEAAKLTLSAEEKQILELTNAERKKKELPPLRPNALLFKAARVHSANMAKQGKLEHKLDGKNSFERVDDTGYQAGAVAENIGLGDVDISPALVFQEWMKSKGHRENIVEKTFTEIGLGLAKGKDGAIYYTQVFATPLQ